MNFSQLPKDILMTIAYELDSTALLNLCRTNQRANRVICQNDLFWKAKLLKTYNISPEKVLPFPALKVLQILEENPNLDLLKAVEKGDLDKVRVALLLSSPNVQESSEIGQTPLILAVINKDSEMVNLLLEAGANPNLNNKFHRGPLSFSEKPEISAALLKAGADPNNQALDGWTALMIIGWDQFIPVTEMLLKSGADPNLQEEDGFTALMLAVGIGAFETVQLLLKSGANPEIQNMNGERAIDMTDDPEMRDLILSYSV